MTNSLSSQLYSKIIATPKQVTTRIAELATDVNDRYEGKSPLFVCLLRGGAPFAVELMRELARINPHFHPELDYMSISTYGNERVNSTPELSMGLSPRTEVAGRLVVLLDDTLDKGVTASFAREELLRTGASLVELIVLVQKQQDRIGKPFESATLSGFSSSGDVWLTGMGLDDTRIAKEANRWTDFVAVATEAV